MTRHRLRPSALLVTLALVAAGCGVTEVAPVTEAPTTTTTTTTSTTTTTIAPSTTTSTVAPTPEVVLTAQQRWKPSQLVLDPGVFIIRNGMAQDVTFSLEERALGEWTLAPGESVQVDLTDEPTARYKLRAQIGLARTTAFVDTRPANVRDINPDDYRVDLSPVVLSEFSVDASWDVFSSPTGRYTIEFDFEFAGPADWWHSGFGSFERTYNDQIDRTTFDIRIVDRSTSVPIQFYYDLGTLQAADGTEWRLFREEHDALPGLVWTHAIVITDSGALNTADLGFWVTLLSAPDEHEHLIEELLIPVVDTIEFTNVTRS